ncbi:MAG: hypothetical protein FWH27_16995 [Planctomycetaceae bacterium]|nr:hypothetical protein [Planctomycetaceae bacterium]
MDFGETAEAVRDHRFRRTVLQCFVKKTSEFGIAGKKILDGLPNSRLLIEIDIVFDVPDRLGDPCIAINDNH